MMKVARSTIGKVFMAVLFGLMSLSLLSFGVPGMTSIGQQNAALVGDYKVTATELDQEFSLELQEEMRRTGTFINRMDALEQGKLEESLARLILRRQMQQAAKDAEVLVTDETVAQNIRNTKGFQDDDGNFDRNRFEFILNQANITPELYAAQQKIDLSRGQMSQTIISGVIAPDLMVDLLRDFEGRARNISYISLSEETMPVTGEPDEAALQNLYETSIESFQLPERRKVAVLRFGPTDVENRVTVTDEQVLAEYNRQIEAFRVDAQRRFEQVLVDTPEQADAILAARADNEPLQETVSKALPDLDTPVLEVDWTEEAALLPELAEQVFSMDVGDVSGAIQTDLGIFVVRLTGTKEAGTRPLDEVRDGIVAQLKRRNATEALFDFSDDIDQALIASRPLEEIAEEYGLTLHTIEGLAEDGTQPYGATRLDGLDYKLVADEAFYLEQGEVSPLLETGGSGYIAVRVEGVTPASTETIDAVHERLVDMWLMLEQRKVAAEAAKVINEALTEGASWEDAIAKAGLEASRIEVKTVTDMTRGDDNGDLPPSLRRAAFELDKEGSADRLRIGNAWNILRLDGLGQVKISDNLEEQVKGALDNTIAFDLLSQYQRLLDQRYPARINYNVVNGFHTPGDS